MARPRSRWQWPRCRPGQCSRRRTQDEWSKINILFIPWWHPGNGFLRGGGQRRQGLQPARRERRHPIRRGRRQQAKNKSRNRGQGQRHRRRRQRLSKPPQSSRSISTTAAMARQSTCRMAFMGQDFFVKDRATCSAEVMRKGNSRRATRCSHRSRLRLHLCSASATRCPGGHSGRRAILGTGNDAEALTKMTQYLIAIPIPPP